MEQEVMKKLCSEYTESLEKIKKRIDEVYALQKSVCSKSEEYKQLYNRRRRLMKIYEDTFNWREMVRGYVKAWEKAE
jgi:Mg2+ and Co2+ transporter CorA